MERTQQNSLVQQGQTAGYSNQLEVNTIETVRKPSLLMRVGRNENWQGAFILIGLLLIFFSTPLLRIGDSYYASTDELQYHSLFVNDPPANFKVSNPNMADTTLLFNPANIYNRTLLWSGKLPLWNPYNAGGAPQIANHSSAVFSPYSVPFYLLPMKLAIIAAAFLRLFSMGLFTFLFLKLLRVHQVPALVGATAFMFCGYNIVWLNYTAAGVLITIPAGCYFAERVFQRVERAKAGRKGRYLWSLVGLCLSLVVGLLAAHAETFAYCLLLVVAFILFRLLNLWHGWHYQRAKLLVLFKVAGQLLLAGLLALGLSALQMLPFFEYLLNSATLTPGNERVADYSLPVSWWPLYFFPYLFGNPVSNYLIPTHNFTEANGPYLACLVIFMAILGLRFVRRDKYIAFFSGAAIVWVLYAYNFLNLKDLSNNLPGLQYGFVARSHPIWLFSLSCCAALFLNHLLRQPEQVPVNPTVVKSGGWRWLRWGQPSLFALIVGLLGSLFLIIGLTGALDYIRVNAANFQPYASSFVNYVPGHVWYIGLTLGAGILALAGLWLWRSRVVKVVLSSLVLVMVFAQSGFLFKDYNPTIPERYFYPTTPSMKTLREITGNSTLLILGWNGILPNVNMVYKISMIPLYDALNIKYYDKLSRGVFEGDQRLLFLIPQRANEADLKMFGIEYLISYQEPFSLDTGLFDAMNAAGQPVPGNEVLAGQTVSQTFKALENDLRRFSVLVHPFKRTNTCNFELKLEDVASGQFIASQSFPCEVIKKDSPVELTFPALPDSRGKTYRIVFSSPDGKPGNAVTVLTHPNLSYNGQLLFNQSPQPGTLHFDFSTGKLENFQQVGWSGDRKVYKYLASPTRYYTVDRAVVASSDDEVYQRVRANAFDPAQTVILSKAPSSGNLLQPPISQPAQPAQVISEDVDRTRLKVSRSQPGYLVLATSHYPGWKAKVNGVEKPVMRANYAFNAIEIGSGESIIEYYYEPNSWTYGLLISLTCAIFGIAIIGWYTRKRRLALKKTSSLSV